MKFQQLLYILLAGLFFSCEFEFSIKKTPSHITIENKGLTNSGITLENHLGETAKSEFLYGEKIKEILF